MVCSDNTQRQLVGDYKKNSLKKLRSPIHHTPFHPFIHSPSHILSFPLTLTFILSYTLPLILSFPLTHSPFQSLSLSHSLPHTLSLSCSLSFAFTLCLTPFPSLSSHRTPNITILFGSFGSVYRSAEALRNSRFTANLSLTARS
jgi:hypothetical protein